MKKGMWLLLVMLSLPAWAGDHAGSVGVVHQTEAKKEKIEYNAVGVVNHVEPIIGMVNLTHSEVPAFGLPAYTRDFKVRPKELLNGVTAGMQIRFRLTAVDPANNVITALEPIQ